MDLYAFGKGICCTSSGQFAPVLEMVVNSATSREVRATMTMRRRLVMAKFTFQLTGSAVSASHTASMLREIIRTRQAFDGDPCCFNLGVAAGGNPGGTDV